MASNWPTVGSAQGEVRTTLEARDSYMFVIDLVGSQARVARSIQRKGESLSSFNIVKGWRGPVGDRESVPIVVAKLKKPRRLIRTTRCGAGRRTRI